jgi:hypothetical protein
MNQICVRTCTYEARRPDLGGVGVENFGVASVITVVMLMLTCGEGWPAGLLAWLLLPSSGPGRAPWREGL